MRFSPLWTEKRLILLRWHHVPHARSLEADITSSAKRCNCASASDFGTPTDRLTEIRERQHPDLRLPGPRRLKLGAERYDQQRRQSANTLDGEVSNTATAGCSCVRSSNRRINTSSVLTLFLCRLRFGGGWRAEAGNDMRSASNATSSSGSATLPRTDSSRANPAARPNWSMTGNRALSLW
jgi:hypothetical protein